MRFTFENVDGAVYNVDMVDRLDTTIDIVSKKVTGYFADMDGYMAEISQETYEALKEHLGFD